MYTVCICMRLYKDKKKLFWIPQIQQVHTYIQHTCHYYKKINIFFNIIPRKLPK